MKAVVQRRYGGPQHLTLGEVESPTIGAGEVLVRVRAASVHPDVWHVVYGRPLVLRVMGGGVWKPKHAVPGTDMAGVVEAVGEDVTRFSPGDPVFGETVGELQWTNGGAYAEYVAAPAVSLAVKPSTVTFEEAAAIPTSGVIAHQGIHHQGQVASGHSVLVNGAGGGVGTIAVQLAAAAGATVTGVDHEAKLGTVSKLGTDHVIDYTVEDFTRGDERYDLILDIAGNHSFRECRRVLAPDGRYVLIGHDHYGAVGRRIFGSLPRFLKLVVLSRFVPELAGMAFSTPPKRESIASLRESLASGALTPVVDTVYSLREVPDAIRYLASGQVVGKVVVSVSSTE